MVLLEYANEVFRWQYVVLYLTKFTNCFSDHHSPAVHFKYAYGVSCNSYVTDQQF